MGHTDSIRLSFRAFSQTFYLHLDPYHDLLHPEGAQVRYYERDARGVERLARTEQLMPSDIRAYHGVVVHTAYTARRLAEDSIGVRRSEGMHEQEGVMGRAAVMLHDDGTGNGTVLFEGTFVWGGNEHTIQTPLNYHTSRQPQDVSISPRSLAKGGMIIHRQSDIMSSLEARGYAPRSAEEEEEDSSTSETGCLADKNDYNANNHLIFSGSNNDDFSMNPMDFFVSPSALAARSHHIRSLSDLFGHGGSKRSASVQHHNPQLDIPLQRRSPSSFFSYEDAAMNLWKRQSGNDQLGGSSNDSYTDSIGQTSGCPSQAMAIYIGVASDCTYTARFPNQGQARNATLTNMATVSQIYRSTFNISVGVVELEVRDATCPTSAQSDAPWNLGCGSYSLDQRLSDFSQWRGSRAANGTALWHLLTACSTGSEVGVAWLGTLCRTEATGSGDSVISSTGVTAVTSREAQVMAHEIGHNFGAIHDCMTGCSLSGSTAQQSGGGAICCPLSSSSCNAGGQYIMNPFSQQDTNAFSPCSVGNICSLLGRGLDVSCVVDPSKTRRETLSAQQCGNGIVEAGEECDAGQNGSNCCTTSCKLTANSKCDPESSACCTSSCQFAGTDVTCRAAVDTRCDTAETCTGTSADCPADQRKDDGASCASGLVCASGHCTSRDQQCQQQSQANYNFTSACSVTADNSCSVSCQDPSNSNSCIVLQSDFIDGTECGYGGHCESGQCQSGSWQSTFASWYRHNLQISIPVTIVIAVIILFILWAIIRCLILPFLGKGSRPKMMGGSKAAAVGGGGGMGRRGASMQQQQPDITAQASYRPVQSHRSSSQQPPMMSDYNAGRQPPPSTWVDPAAYNGNMPSNGGMSYDTYGTGGGYHDGHYR